jgi:ABC-type branched-subunit amino acid transport system substrate-binding protein
LIVARNCAFCVDLERLTKIYAPKYEIPISETVDVLKKQNTESLLAEAGSGNFDAIGIFAYGPEALQIIRAIPQNLKKKVLIFGGDSYSSSSPELMGEADKRKDICLFNTNSFDFQAANLALNQFKKKFLEFYKKPATELSAFGYDLGGLLRKTAKICSKSKEQQKCARNTLATSNYLGVTGPIKFKPDGSRDAVPILMKSPGCTLYQK